MYAFDLVSVFSDSIRILTCVMSHLLSEVINLGLKILDIIIIVFDIGKFIFQSLDFWDCVIEFGLLIFYRICKAGNKLRVSTGKIIVHTDTGSIVRDVGSVGADVDYVILDVFWGSFIVCFNQLS